MLSAKKKIILFIAILGTVILLNQGNPPEFFDQFGVFIFSFLTLLGFWMLKTKRELSDNFAFAVLVTGIVGLIVDGSIVFGLV